MPSKSICRFVNRDLAHVAAWIFSVREIYSESFKVYVERVNERPYEANQFQFGFNCGVITGMLIAARCEIIPVEAEIWQQHFGVAGRLPNCKHDQYRGCDTCSYTARKHRAQVKAQELFPEFKVTLDMADAMLIALYGYHKENGYVYQKPVDELRPGTGFTRRVARDF